MSLPEGWIESTVGRVVVDLQSGFAQKPGEDDDGMTPQIRTHNITPEGKITLEGIKHVSASVKELERCRLAVNDVVFNNTNSEEWVGKTAVFNQEGEYVFSNHMTRLRADTSLINPAFLGSYLHLLWSMGYSKTRAKRWVSQAGIEGAALASFKIPLPTLPEQQRIVDVLRQAEALAGQQQSRDRRLDSMIKAYLDRLVLAVGASEWVQLSDLVETRYGTSISADASADSGTPVLRIPNVMGGEVDTSDMKYVEISTVELGRLCLTRDDVLIVRSNGNPDYVGRSAPITEEIEKAAMVYASYLIRLRTDGKRLLSEYLSAFLNSAFGRAAMRNAIRTTAGQSNLSGENLTRIRIPLPAIAEQKKFAAFWHEVRKLRKLIDRSGQEAAGLRSEITALALSGELTKAWRDKHRAELLRIATVRDDELRTRSATVTTRIMPTAVTLSLRTDITRPARRWLFDELSEFQQRVLSAFLAYTAQPLLADDPDAFAAFCADEALTEQLAGFSYSPDRIRRTLSQLAALGLIARITLPHVNPLTLERQYLQAFRPLRDDEHTQFADVEALRRALSPPGEVDE